MQQYSQWPRSYSNSDRDRCEIPLTRGVRPCEGASNAPLISTALKHEGGYWGSGRSGSRAKALRQARVPRSSEREPAVWARLCHTARLLEATDPGPFEPPPEG